QGQVISTGRGLMESQTRSVSRKAEAVGYEGGLHCDLRVTNLSRALDWYQDVLGFSVIHHVPANGWAELQSPVADVRVGLTEVESMPPPGGGAVLTFTSATSTRHETPWRPAATFAST